MKQITMFEASDGRKFNTEKECLTYETTVMTINQIMARLPARPDNGSRFVNGKGYIQHNKAVFLRAQRALVHLLDASLAEDSTYERHISAALASEIPVGLCFIGRLIDDMGPAPLRTAWNRILCTNSRFREYGQPYYALHPEKAEGGCINL